MCKQLTICILHDPKNQDKAVDIYQALSDAGFTHLMMSKDIVPGEDKEEFRERLIKECHFCLVCFSKDAKDGEFNKAVKEARERQGEMGKGEIFLIPVRIEDYDASNDIGKFYPVDWFGGNEQDALERLTKAFKFGAERRKLESKQTEQAAITPPGPERHPKSSSDGGEPSYAADAKNGTKAKLSIEADKTTVVLIGASKFPKDPENLAPLPAVENNIRDLKKALCDDSIVGLKSADIHILDEPKASDVLTELAEICSKTEDALIVYYAGHGLVSKRSKQLYLATKDTTDKHAEFNAMPFEAIQWAIDSSCATKKILIVDSCFSGRIMSNSQGGMSSASSLLQSNLEFDEVVSIASAPAGQSALAPPGEEYTVFTGELIKALNEGLDNNKEVINLKELFEHIKRNLKKHPGVPEPQSFNIHNADKIIFARNHKHVQDEMKKDSAEAELLKGTTDLPQSKQLYGIVEVLFHCHSLLDNSIKAGGNIWFAGLTCAFGPVHNIPHIRGEWLKKYPGEFGLDEMSEEFNQNLLAMMAGAGDSSKIVIVTLQKELVKSKFIDPLYTRSKYKLCTKNNKWHLKWVESQIEKFQEKVEKAASMHEHTIAYVEEMPRQAIVTQIREDDGVEKTVCVVIEVGTQNVGKRLASGFYSENLDECEKWKKYINELYDSGSVSSDG